MKAVLLAGGLGTRISEESHARPKPMIEIGNMPLIWHIMKFYSHYNVNDFVICCGYKGYVIKEYFQNYFLHMSDVTFDMKINELKVYQKNVEPWTVTLVDTGENTETGGRLLRVAEHIKDEVAFCFSYGDGLTNANLSLQLEFHKQQGKLATLLAVQPPARYGWVEMDGAKINKFSEKPRGDGGLINGGFFILSPKVLNYIVDDTTSWEEDCLNNLATDNQLVGYEHRGFWKAMDTLRDKNYLESAWQNGTAPWKIW